MVEACKVSRGKNIRNPRHYQKFSRSGTSRYSVTGGTLLQSMACASGQQTSCLRKPGHVLRTLPPICRHNAIAKALNERQMPTRRNGKWHAASVQRLLCQQMEPDGIRADSDRVGTNPVMNRGYARDKKSCLATRRASLASSSSKLWRRPGPNASTSCHRTSAAARRSLQPFFGRHHQDDLPLRVKAMLPVRVERAMQLQVRAAHPRLDAGDDVGSEPVEAAMVVLDRDPHSNLGSDLRVYADLLESALLHGKVLRKRCEFRRIFTVW